MIFYYIRHGDPIYNPDSLTELGHKQAEALAKRLSLYGFDKIFCSTSNRAQLTAEPTCKALGITPVCLDFANEHYAWKEFSIPSPRSGKNHWCFQTGEMIEKLCDPSVRALGFEWYKHEFFKDYPSFESGMKRIENATDEFLLSLGYRHDREACGYVEEEPNDRRVALFAHQGFGLLFLSCLMDIPYPYFSTHFDFGHSSVTVIKFDSFCEHGNRSVSDDGKKMIYPKMLQLSNDSHLYKENILTGYQNTLDI